MDVVVDIWGGQNSMDHMARFVVPRDQALTIADGELQAGYLVNLRADPSMGSDQNFDSRTTPA